ncbi:MAG: hypothetical protein NAG76_22885 [Candidatus Pristimantibacillus lignocellulolyticus]|uniref:Lipoprotein n=1 Tax=Candidatus Pristimantibacillus lignocellulolyticus TaxID=2994561 RepID=A0A9J6ZEN7_9BACL|nr:MAG: hypothetical protein NAG76_22885 [Candidatus Pristimantibacillus lignocellulolyticus]
MKQLLVILSILLLSACSSGNNTISNSKFKAEIMSAPSLYKNNIPSFNPDPIPVPEQSSEVIEVKRFADFPYLLVRWNNQVYRVTEDEVVEIDSEIGEIITRLTSENYEESDNSSNAFNSGTKLWSIEGIDTTEAIAVQRTEDVYIKLVADVPSE